MQHRSGTEGILQQAEPPLRPDWNDEPSRVDVGTTVIQAGDVKPVIVFDLNETLLDMSALDPKLSTPQPANKVRIPVRAIAGVDRTHYTVSPMEGWASPPATCPVESAPDERHAVEIGAGGIELLPDEARRRIAALWDAADQVARQNGFELTHARDWVLTLFEGRVALVTNDAQLTLARANVGRLIATACAAATRRDFRVLQDFFLNEALFSLPLLPEAIFRAGGARIVELMLSIGWRSTTWRSQTSLSPRPSAGSQLA